jgi:hypothetical protein
MTTKTVDIPIRRSAWLLIILIFMDTLTLGDASLSLFAAP